ncbi:MAG: hypothetical protein D6698_05395 [Gammaproteobacteria bacterium]|nr:MAG: hypothetical protein D6698_05395 [Gammaproteobacteria bacterium]
MNQYSVSFAVGYQQQYDMNLDQVGVVNLNAGIGQAYSLVNDMDIYAMLEAGGAAGRGETFGYLEPKAGIIIREIWNMKSHFEWKIGLNYFNQSERTQQIQWQQAKYFGTRHALVGSWNWVWNSRQESQGGFVGYRYYF